MSVLIESATGCLSSEHLGPLRRHHAAQTLGDQNAGNFSDISDSFQSNEHIKSSACICLAHCPGKGDVTPVLGLHIIGADRVFGPAERDIPRRWNRLCHLFMCTVSWLA